VEVQSVKYNGKAFRPQDLKKEGSQLAGWQLNGAIYDFTQLVTESITLTAFWQMDWPVRPFSDLAPNAYICNDEVTGRFAY
jgi:hypothetical protein